MLAPVASFISEIHRLRGRLTALHPLFLNRIVVWGLLSGDSLVVCANYLICYLLVNSETGTEFICLLTFPILFLSLLDTAIKFVGMPFLM